MEIHRELYTDHGLHLNWKGKEVMADKIVNVIKDILKVQKAAPIGMKWREEEMTECTQSRNCETAERKNDQYSIDTKANIQENSERGRGDCEPVNLAALQPK
jgi:hypothetical protein